MAAAPVGEVGDVGTDSVAKLAEFGGDACEAGGGGGGESKPVELGADVAAAETGGAGEVGAAGGGVLG